MGAARNQVPLPGAGTDPARQIFLVVAFGLDQDGELAPSFSPIKLGSQSLAEIVVEDMRPFHLGISIWVQQLGPDGALRGVAEVHSWGRVPEQWRPDPPKEAP
jgi:hypothetical protein